MSSGPKFPHRFRPLSRCRFFRSRHARHVTELPISMIDACLSTRALASLPVYDYVESGAGEGVPPSNLAKHEIETPCQENHLRTRW